MVTYISSLVSNGFKTWHCPNSFYSRTSKNIYLATKVTSGVEITSHLLTPFGEVEFISSNFFADLQAVSGEFLRSVDWDIVDVTESINTYEFQDDADNGNTGRTDFIHLVKPVDTKFYLVKRISTVTFATSPEDEHFYFSFVASGIKEQDLDKGLFHHISQGTDSF